MLRIQITHNGKFGTMDADPSKTLAQNLFVRGFIRHAPLCSGLGTCGQCAALFHGDPPVPSSKDMAFFTTEELARGLRLGCSHYPQEGQSLELTQAEEPAWFEWAGRENPVCLGIDMGTTSLKWGFLHPEGRMSLGQTVNPQMGAGPDIMSRLSFAREDSDNYKLLSRLLTREVQSILDLGPVPEKRVCVSGNPAMLYFLLSRDISGLSVSPYVLEYVGGVWEDLGRKPVKAFVPSLWSPFVGADISAGLSWILEEIRPAYPFLLADFGTNGELVLALSPERYLATSVALGPALEGIGLRWGSPYREGVASRFLLGSRGIEPGESWHTGRISGSGYISLLGHLIRLRLISAQGHFTYESSSPIARKIVENVKNGRLYLDRNLYMDGQDIEEILKVKAAFTLGLSFLCSRGGVLPDELSAIYIAGALGEHSNLIDLETLGFFPPGSSHKSRVVGNTSLKGAILLAGDNDKIQENIGLARFVESVNLGFSQDYISRQFARHMLFKYPR